MIKSLQINFFIAVLTVFLSGCSIVVFEDGSECPAEKSCPAEASSVLDTVDEKVEIIEDLVPPVIEGADETQIKIAETTDQLTDDLANANPVVDGYVTNFAYDSSVIAPELVNQLVSIAKFLADNPDIFVTIEGHCDERGSRDYNLALGDRRAVAVRDVLTANGVDMSRIKTISYGKERPIARGSSLESWAKNRRAVIIEKNP